MPTILDVKRFEDDRGWFIPWFVSSERPEIEVKQINFNKTNKDAFRGFHFGVGPDAQKKYISCIKGRVLDFVIDVRPNSNEFGKIHKFELSSNSSKVLYIPTGFAHGIYGVSDESYLVYAASKEWDPELEIAINPLDPSLNLGIETSSLICTEKDLKGMSLLECKKILAEMVV